MFFVFHIIGVFHVIRVLIFDLMKFHRSLFILAFFCVILSCKKTSFITSSDALLLTSTDTLHFDTVFTTTGSITQSFKIFNINDQKLLLSKVELAGGINSTFKINVDGVAETSFSNIEIAANDSIYVFVEASINPNANNLPFLVQDSINITYNGNEQWVQLDAYGQNAHFLRNATVTKDTVWSNELPVVILATLTVDVGKTLTINKGVQVYNHANGKIIVNGSLHALGERDNKIVFTSDRLDDYYKDLPASWEGIVFSESSKDNLLNYCEIKNASDAVTINNPSTDNNPKLKLNECVINNASGSGIWSNNSSIDAVNCLIYNCGNNIQITAGGNYNFTHCTVVGYPNNFVSHLNPVLSITNADSNNQTFALNANFINSIFYGDEGIVNDEILVQQSGSSSFTLNFENDLYKGSGSIGNFTDCIQNQDPLFINIDAGENVFDLHLLNGSPCINAGKKTSAITDLDNNARDEKPDIGCYEAE